MPGAFSLTVSSHYGRDDADVVMAYHSDRPEKRLAELDVLEAALIPWLVDAKARLTFEIEHG